ncbi:TRAFAC clade GTPase domain-containing protein [Streptosporangium saharense]|uniref:TRAFAC clade GTPase domain-containing protein n=1 Tax=Streptosporangium saharense TaxID=1706840 RepID=UPI00342008BD
MSLWVVIAVVALPVLSAVALTLAATVLAAVWHYLRQSCRVLLSRTADGPSEVPRPGGRGGDPAYRIYALRQIWRDLAVLDEATRPVVVDRVRAVRDWIGQRWGERPQVYFLFPLWLGAETGVVLAVVLLTLALAVPLAAYTLVTAVTLLVWLPCVLVLRGLDLAFTVANRVLQVCQNADCYERLTLPEYACPSCGARHRRLRPNADGAFRHVCACGARLPTTILLGRHRLAGHCPGCGRALSPRTGRVRAEPLPFVGGPDAGKTTFMTLVVTALHAAVEANGGRATFVTRQDELAFTRNRDEMRQGGVSKTPTPLPTAMTLDVSGLRGGDRILHLFDPSGEHHTGATTVEALGYLTHGERMVLVVDPFALPLVRGGLTTAERDALSAAGVSFSLEDPADTFQRVRAELASRPGGSGLRRVAVVVSKADLLERTGVGRGVGEVSRWLGEMGLGNMVRELSARTGETRYLASGLPSDPVAVARLVAWLVELPLAVPDELPEGRPVTVDSRRPWRASPRREGLVPVGYAVTRWAVLAASVLLPGALVAVAISALTAW